MAYNNLTIYNERDEGTPAVWPAFGLPLIEDLPDPFPIEMLEREDFFIIVGRLVSESIRCDQTRDAIELINHFRLLKGFKQQRPDLWGRYQNLINLLKFVSLANRKETEIIRLFEQGLLEALRGGIDVKDKIQTRVTLYDFSTDDIQLVKNLIYTLEHNGEVLGIQPIQIIGDNKDYLPSLGNWLRDYNFQTKGKGGGVGRATYMSQNNNMRRLNKEDQATLIKLFEFYDFLRETSAQLLEQSYTLGMVKTEKIELPPGLFPDSRVWEADNKNIDEELNQSIENLNTAVAQKFIAPKVEKKLIFPITMVPRPNIPPQMEEDGRQIGHQLEDVKQIRNDIEQKKRLAQQKIDQKLEELKKRKINP